MKTSKGSQNYTSYLDVSQFIIKEPSPLMRPVSPQHHPHRQTHRTHETPQIAPIDHDTSQMFLTPLHHSLIVQDIHQIMEDFILQSPNGYVLDNRRENDKKKAKKNQQRQWLSLPIFKLECELQKIIQDDKEQSLPSQSQEDQDQSDSEDDSEKDHRNDDYRTNHTLWGSRIKSRDCSFRDIEQQKLTTIDISLVDYSQTIERFSKNPKTQIISAIKELQAQPLPSEEFQKKKLLKQFLEQYLLEYQIFCYQQSWKDMNETFENNVQTIIAGIQQTFSKKIGCLPFEQRRVKLLKYLQKKKKRIWRKKVSYDCRKKVADGRLRIKGKFVTREQACEQLGLESLDNYSADQIKQMLQRKIDNSLNQPLLC